MTVPWRGRQDDECEQLIVFDCLQSLAAFELVDFNINLELCNNYSPDYYNLHSKTVRDSVEHLDKFVAVRQRLNIKGILQKTAVKSAAFFCIEITLNRDNNLVFHLSGVIVVYSHIHESKSCFKKQLNFIRTCGKHRKSVCKSSCYGMSSHKCLKEICRCKI